MPKVCTSITFVNDLWVAEKTRQVKTRLVVDSDKPESCGVGGGGGGPQDFSDKSLVGLVNFILDAKMLDMFCKLIIKQILFILFLSM